MTRIIDGEASHGERQVFEASAQRDPALWRELAQRLVDSRDLEHQFDAAVAPAMEVELPRVAARRTAAPAWRAVAGLGWAAAAVIGLAWVALPRQQAPAPAPTAMPAVGRGVDLTPDEHIERYLATSPAVIRELPRMVLEVRREPDGRVYVTYIRRIEESRELAPGEEVRVDDLGRWLPVDAPGGNAGEPPADPGR